MARFRGGRVLYKRKEKKIKELFCLAIYLHLDRLIGLPEYRQLLSDHSRVRYPAHYLWLRLLIEAKRINDHGRFSHSRTQPYTMKAIGQLTYMPNPRTLKHALDLLHSLQLITVKAHIIYVSHWDYLTRQAEHQLIPAATPPTDVQPPFQSERRYPLPKVPLTEGLKKQARDLLFEFNREQPDLNNGQNLRYVIFWLQQGYNPATLARVYQFKRAEWQRSPRMQPFIRPSTIFGAKFPSYQAALPAPPHVHHFKGPTAEAALTNLCVACNFDVAAILKQAAREHLTTTEAEVTALVQSLRV
ncbi:hypothetical protein LB003_07160 [Loigolactobacillus bifermentans]|nr:hypothetical protein LB003_07160 [Loigolactobacillus bifermentans]